jgi:hypothetical protein
MRYHIKDELGDIIASFYSEIDRDISFDALKKKDPFYYKKYVIYNG